MILSKFNKKLIFIIGSGRSGTHLLGRTFENSPEIDAFIEDEHFFEPISNLAVGLNKNRIDFNKILKKYKKVFKKSRKEVILEKTHPNIWFVEDIIDFFPEAKFLGIKRNAFGTVSSMLKHKGVLSWYEKLPLNEINPFLGITESNKDNFKDLPIESKCAIRWLAHKNRLEYLEKKFPQNVLVVNYEDFYDEYESLMKRLKEFLDLDFELRSEPLKPQGRDKWRNNLNEIQINNIDKLINKTNV